VIYGGTQQAFEALIDSQKRTNDRIVAMGDIRLHDPIAADGNRFVYASKTPFSITVTCVQDGAELHFCS
jgi:hypothetical protein